MGPGRCGELRGARWVRWVNSYEHTRRLACGPRAAPSAFAHVPVTQQCRPLKIKYKGQPGRFPQEPACRCVQSSRIHFMLCLPGSSFLNTSLSHFLFTSLPASSTGAVVGARLLCLQHAPRAAPVASLPEEQTLPLVAYAAAS